MFDYKFKNSDSKPLTFSSVTQLFDFFSKEKSFWQFINKTSNHERMQYGMSYLRPIDNLVDYISPLISKETEDLQPHERSEIENRLSLINFSDGETVGIPLSNHPISNFLLELSQHNPTRATDGFLYLVNPTTNTPEFLSIGIQIEAFKLGILKESKVVGIKPLTKLSHDWGLQVEKVKLYVNELEIKSNSTIQNFDAQSSKSLETAQLEFIEKKNEITQEWTNLKNAFRDELSLKEPVTYWSSKEEIHSNRFGWMLFLSSILSVLFFISVRCLIFKTFKLDTAVDDIKHWQSAIIILTIFLFIWAIRVVVKLMFTHFHLMLDARERVTMVKTYLSLLSDGKGLGENDRQLMLTALFRPSGTGIVKDDTIPPSWIALLTAHKSAH